MGFSRPANDDLLGFPRLCRADLQGYDGSGVVLAYGRVAKHAANKERNMILITRGAPLCIGPRALSTIVCLSFAAGEQMSGYLQS